MPAEGTVENSEGSDAAGQEATRSPEGVLAEWTAALLDEIDEALSSDNWAILDSGSDGTRHRLYDAAALRHCAALLFELATSGAEGRELGTCVLYRTHVEAFLFALYIHFGGIEAVKRVSQATLASLRTTDNEIKAWDEWLKNERKRKAAACDKIRQNNAANFKWNAAHQDEPARPILGEPYVPQLSTTGVDLSDAIESFGDLEPRALPLRTVVDELTRLGPERGFGRESFTPMYNIYRVVSTGSLHPTVSVLEAYFLPRGFVWTLPVQVGPSMIMDAWGTALYSTAFLAGWVLGDAGSVTTVSSFLRQRLEPSPSGGRGWMPGL